MITVKKNVAKVIKESTITSAYVISRGIAISAEVIEALTDDLQALNTLEATELVTASKELVERAIAFCKSPTAQTEAQARVALSNVGDLLMRTKEVK